MVKRLAALALCVAVLTSCGDDGDGGTGASEERTGTESPSGPASSGSGPSSTGRPSEPQSRTREPTSGTEIVVGDSEFGEMLFDAAGQAIYLFDVETTSQPQCYDDCAAAWPPVLTDGEPVAGTGVDAALLGTVSRRDGSTQVTYNDHPLYFYAHEGPGEVLCHDVFLNGGNWYVVQPGGDAAPPG